MADNQAYQMTEPCNQNQTANNNGKTQYKNNMAAVENGRNGKCIPPKPESSSGGFLTCNVGYLKSWQSFLKLCKMFSLVAMVIAFSLSLDGILKNLPRTEVFQSTWDKVPVLEYGLALAVIGLFMELVIFIIYLTGMNMLIEELCGSKIMISLALTTYHLVMWIMLFVAPILLHATWTGKSVTAYIAFATLALIGYSFELYFNLVWLRGGPEHAVLPCF